MTREQKKDCVQVHSIEKSRSLDRNRGQSREVAFRAIGDASLANAAWLVPALLPHGRREGREWVALNPTRDDRRLGSFRIRLDSGLWCDFACGPEARGRDLIGLLAYLNGIPMKDAAIALAQILGVNPYTDGRHG
jgi:hypothetical protein